MYVCIPYITIKERRYKIDYFYSTIARKRNYRKVDRGQRCEFHCPSLVLTTTADNTRMINSPLCSSQQKLLLMQLMHKYTMTFRNVLISFNKQVASYLDHTVVLSLICVIFNPDLSHTFPKGVFHRWSTGGLKRSDSCSAAIKSNWVKTSAEEESFLLHL